ERTLDLVAARLRELVQARIVLIALPANEGGLVVRALDGAEELVGRRLEQDGSKAGRVLGRGRSERVDSMIDDLEVDQELSRRLARERHDETGQALTSILLGLRSLEDVGSEQELAESTSRLRELVVTTLQDVRRLAVELRPKALDDFGLVPALERLVETFREQTGIEVDLEPHLG